jgi:hypothetical protein
MEYFNFLHAKALYLRFSIIFGEKFTKSYHDEEFKDIWYSEWVSGLAGIDVSFIKDALDYCKLNLEWAPSLAEFRRICEKASGFPDPSEIMKAAIRGDFYHPIIKLIYDKIGSWEMKRATEKDLIKCINAIYEEEIANHRMKLYREHQLLENPKIIRFEEKGSTHGSEVTGNNIRRDNMRKA